MYYIQWSYLSSTKTHQNMKRKGNCCRNICNRYNCYFQQQVRDQLEKFTNKLYFNCKKNDQKLICVGKSLEKFMDYILGEGIEQQQQKMQVLNILIPFALILIHTLGSVYVTPLGTTVLMKKGYYCENGCWKNTITNECYCGTCAFSYNSSSGILVTDLGLQEGAGHQSTIFGELFVPRNDSFKVYSEPLFYNIALHQYYNYHVYDNVSQTSTSPSYGRDIRGHTIFFAITLRGSSTQHSLTSHFYDLNTNDWFGSTTLTFPKPINYDNKTSFCVSPFFNYFGIINRALGMKELGSIALVPAPAINGNSLPVKTGSYHFSSVEALYKTLYGVDVCTKSCGSCGDMQFTDNPQFITLASEKCGTIDTKLYNLILNYYVLNYAPLDGKPSYNSLVTRTRYLASIDLNPTTTLKGNILIVSYKITPFANALSLGFLTYIQGKYGARMKVPGLTVDYGPEYYQVTSVIDYQKLIKLGCQRTATPSYVCLFFLDFVGLDSYGGYGALLKSVKFTVEILYNPETKAITNAVFGKSGNEEVNCNCVIATNIPTKLKICEGFQSTKPRINNNAYKIGDTINLIQEIEDPETKHLFKVSPFSATFSSSSGLKRNYVFAQTVNNTSTPGAVTIELKLNFTGKLTISILSILTPIKKRVLEDNTRQVFMEKHIRQAIETELSINVVESDEDLQLVINSKKADYSTVLLIGIVAGVMVLAVIGSLIYSYYRKVARTEVASPATAETNNKQPNVETKGKELDRHHPYFNLSQ
eukprot:TRINITY_DN7232_c0_g1_i1.p1 TRINITY_DN7232_c0_g1~~TRINITY_DN7232_c0_g1_i1.p1  ORF type:complete len:759 (-),score=-7.44 TRINITY_DN7232_c0_g1_i1:90-2366(-)